MRRALCAEPCAQSAVRSQSAAGSLGLPPLLSWRIVLTHHARGAGRLSAGDGAASLAFRRSAPGNGDCRGPQRWPLPAGEPVRGAMRRSKAEVERYIASVQGFAPSPREVSGDWRHGWLRPGRAAAPRGARLMAPAAAAPWR